jgi:hypothetical protein
MAKRRTKKQKEGAKHVFNVSWAPSEAGVKGQFNFEPKKPRAGSHKHESALSLAKDASLASIKKDIVKSLIVVSLILALEVVLYLAWYA